MTVELHGRALGVFSVACLAGLHLYATWAIKVPGAKFQVQCIQLDREPNVQKVLP